ncbi:TadE/TadG family type IV pilus assembly protein [Sphingomonas sp. 4RDLI-65]|uniref:TadE/TadG family type IV pilus assembly protein n=1 Tax=Sphingomonas sp. 4RDLI-65 TaxID=3111641 RepID=UPI003C15DCF2
MKWRRASTSLAADQRGVALVEFALVAPVLVLFLVGAFDIAHTLYMQAVLRGIVQKTGRDSALEDAGSTARQAAIDADVTSQVRLLYNSAAVKFTRRSFTTYAQAAAKIPEVYTDTNLNLTCDAGEPYIDANNNNAWDPDGGGAGQGGAKDRVIYTVTATYPAILPLYKYAGGTATRTVSATTILQNQPYSDQQVTTGTATRYCP